MRGHWWIAIVGGLLLTTGTFVVAGCESGGRVGSRQRVSVYPPAPQTPRVIALGSMLLATGPSERERAVSEVLFGEPLRPTLPVVLPSAIAVTDEATLICDSARSALLAWTPGARQLRVVHQSEHQSRPHDVAAFEGGFALADQSGVQILDAAGGLRQRLTMPSGGPAGGVAVHGDTLYGTDPRGHQVVVFDLATGEQTQSIGTHGTGPGELAQPRGIAVTDRGDVIVVDTLNNRVRVFAPDGEWLRDIGGPGYTPGSFGRPRDVAIGPDGTVFVSDAFSQRIHAFTAEGQPLLAFGTPGSGLGALALPLGVAVTTAPLPTTEPLPAGRTAAYYVLVAEQLRGPGIRVYAWLAGNREAAEVDGFTTREWQPRSPEMAALNPHFEPTRCDMCHTPELGPGKIAADRVDALCLSCHDGVRAPADPHPIGRPAQTTLVSTPEAFPTPDGLLGCLSCHDIVQHCTPTADRRPAWNPVLLREFDPRQRLDYCAQCHVSSIGDRFSPHQQFRNDASLRAAACGFCHTQEPHIPADGRRRFEPHLRTDTSALCLNCHDRHWDLSPRGHVDREMTPETLRKLLAQESRLGARGNPQPALLPLGADETVTCYTCHNPHHPETFPPGTELASLASDPDDRVAGLRLDWLVLCSACHEH